MSRSLRFISFLILLTAPSCVCAQTLAAQADAGRALAFAGYLGGSGAEAVQAVAAAKDGGIWVAGSSSSAIDFPGPNSPYQASIRGGRDIFLAKYRMNAGGTAEILFWTWIGGSGNEDVRAMALDSYGRVYIVGSTESTDFPMGGYAFQTSNAGETDSYILIVDPNIPGQDSLVFSSYFGGAKKDVATALAIEPSGAVVVGGYTESTDLPKVSGNAQSLNRGGWDGFVMRMDPSLPSPVTFATYYGGSSTDIATGIALDKDRRVWLTGYTASSDFPSSGNAYSLTLTGAAQGFLVQLDLSKPGLDAILYGTYFGGSSLDVPERMAIDADGKIWVAGYTLSGDFPLTAHAARPFFGGGADAFVTQFDMTKPAAQAIAYSTYFGGGDAEVLHGFTLLGGGKFAICGYTLSADFPVVGTPIQARQASPFADAFVAVIDTNVAGSAAIQFSSYYGGSYEDVANDLVSDAAGNLYLGGYTKSADLRMTDGSTKQNAQPSATGFILKIGQ